MQSLKVLIITCLLFLALVSARAPPTKLQVGVKHRPETCERKTRNGDRLAMHYTGSLFDDGSVFDSSIPRGEPFKFVLGTGSVIKGWDEGLTGMCIGEKRKLLIPADKGYGARGMPPKIPANAALVFEVELLDIENK